MLMFSNNYFNQCGETSYLFNIETYLRLQNVTPIFFLNTYHFIILRMIIKTPWYVQIDNCDLKMMTMKEEIKDFTEKFAAIQTPTK